MQVHMCVYACVKARKQLQLLFWGTESVTGLELTDWDRLADQ